MRHDADVLKKLYGYMDDVLEERIEVGRYTKLYVKRQADDLARASRGEIRGVKDEKYVFDEAKIVKVVHSMQLFPALMGRNADKAIELMPWQVMFMGLLFGWVSEDRGWRRFRTAYLSMARQNGKTLMGALIALRCFIFDGEGMAQVYAAAGDKEQAMIVYNRIKLMLERRRDIMVEFGIDIFRSLTRGIQKDDGGELRPLAKDMRGNLDGKSVHCGILDELHAHQKRDTWDSMEKGKQARDQPLIVGLTTAGDDASGLAYEKFDYSRKILEGDVQDDTFLACVYQTDEALVERGDIYGERAWRQACPSYDLIEPESEYVSQSKQAKHNALARHSFHTKMLNVWGTKSVGWMNMTRFDDCAEKLNWPFFYGPGKLHIGMDLAAMNDLCAVAVSREVNGKCYTKVAYWLPERTVEMKKNVPYDDWAKRRLLSICPGDTIDFEMIEGFILDLHRNRKCRIHNVLCDPFQAAATVSRLEKARIKVAKFHQRPSYYDYPMNALHKAVLDGNYIHDGSEVTEWCFGNCVLKVGQDDKAMPVRDRHKPDQKVDGAQASVMAYSSVIMDHRNVMTDGWFGSMIPKDDKNVRKTKLKK